MHLSARSCTSALALWVATSALAQAQWTSQIVPNARFAAIANGQIAGGLNGDAAIWDANLNFLADLGPGELVGTDGVQQVGVGPTFGPTLWSGTAASLVDLSPAAGLGIGVVTGVNGGRQCGYFLHSITSTAGFWQNLPTAFFGLSAPSSIVAEAHGIHGDTIAGWYRWSSTPHACYWFASTGEFHDLSQDVFTTSKAFAVHGDVQGGEYLTATGIPHAAMWTGTPASRRDLHPAGASASSITAVYGPYQVGYATFGGVQHAGLWTGSASSFLDLSLVSGPTAPQSATGVWVDAAGNVYVVGNANGVESRWWKWSNTATTHCAGDGSSGACPCGNVSAPGSQQGCANSSGLGTRLVGAGLSSVATDGFSLQVSNLPVPPVAPGFVLYLQGTTPTSVPFADGLRCVGGSLVRMAVQAHAGSTASYPGTFDPRVSVKGLLPVTGGVRYYQVWHRDVGLPCGSNSNLSNGVSVTWVP